MNNDTIRVYIGVGRVGRLLLAGAGKWEAVPDDDSVKPEKFQAQGYAETWLRETVLDPERAAKILAEHGTKEPTT